MKRILFSIIILAECCMFVSAQMTVCTQDAMKCPDGSWVGRSGDNCQFVCPKITQQVVCTSDAFTCPDGVAVGRTGSSCQFDCSTHQTAEQPRTTACSYDMKICPDGSAVSRTGQFCEFATCPTVILSPQQSTVCTADAYTCPNGSMVGRTGPNCQFVCPAPYTVAPIQPIVACQTITRSMRIGSRDTASNQNVTILQNFLISRGYVLTYVTGYYGKYTAQGVAAFQKMYNIPSSGSVGFRTATTINDILCPITNRY